MNFALCGQFWWPNQKYFYLKVVAHIRCHAYWIIYPLAILKSPKIEERGALFYEPNFPVFSNLEWFFWIMVLEELVTIFCPIIWSLMWFFDLLSEKIQKRPNSIFWLIECPHYTVNHYGHSINAFKAKTPLRIAVSIFKIFEKYINQSILIYSIV